MKKQTTKQDVTAQDVTVIVDDRLIIVDGRAIKLDNSITQAAFTMPEGHHEGLRALQWHNGAGDCECTEKGEAHNHVFGVDKYDQYVKPFVDMWEAQRIIDDAPAPEKTPEELAATRIQEIHSELSNIDTKSMRPTRSIEVKRAYNKANTLDTDAGLEDELATLSGLEETASTLRMELHLLENTISPTSQTASQTESQAEEQKAPSLV